MSVAPLHVTLTCVLDAAVAVTVEGAAGGTVSGTVGATAVFMSAVIADADSARSYTRTSSIRPMKYWPYGLLPPIHNGLLLVSIGPNAAAVATCVPFTKIRIIDPSYVIATCVHAPTGFGVDPLVQMLYGPNTPPPDGSRSPLPLLAFRK